MSTPLEIAARFKALEVHDDTVERFSFVPSATNRALPKVEIILFRHWVGTRRLITFTGCANFEVVLDGDVLKDNAPNNTSSFAASTDRAEIEALAQRHRKSWGVSYPQSLDPLPRKLSGLDRLILFRVCLFGGHLLVLARAFTSKRLPASSSALGQVPQVDTVPLRLCTD